MNDKIKNAFNQIKANEELKHDTLEYIDKKRLGNHPFYKRLMPIALSLLLFFIIGLVGYKVYYTSVASISIDINPSVELSINRFDKIISVKGYNNDGVELAKRIDINNLNYKDGVKKILEMDFDYDAVISVTVTGKAKEQKQNELYNLDRNGKKCDVHFDLATNEEVTEAHKLGLSFGKYKAFKKISEFDCEITPEDIKDMNMKDIHQKLKEHQDWNSNKGQGNNDNKNTGSHGGKGDTSVSQNGFQGGRDDASDTQNGFHGGRDDASDTQNGFQGGKGDTSDSQNGFHGGKGNQSIS